MIYSCFGAFRSEQKCCHVCIFTSYNCNTVLFNYAIFTSSVIIANILALPNMNSHTALVLNLTKRCSLTLESAFCGISGDFVLGIESTLLKPIYKTIRHHF